ncbi:sensor histidine kinase [Noviherbaspirillum saxi]|nr:histidine kinase [Noviherbaspirillum saxi]
MIARMRLVLAVSMLLTGIIDLSDDGLIHRLSTIVFFGYVLYAIAIVVGTERKVLQSQEKTVHWLDIWWFALIIIVTGGSLSPFFLCFFFAILTTSFRWGFEEGASATLVSAGILITCGLFSESVSDLPRVLMRSAFLLAIGYMSAYWGDSKAALTRRLQLLREVSRLSNPRFGIDQTINSVLGKIKDFYGARECILVLRDVDTGACSIRIYGRAGTSGAVASDKISVTAAAPLLALPEACITTYISSSWPLRFFSAKAHYLDGESQKWIPIEAYTARNVAEILEASCYISAPVVLMRNSGRLYVTAHDRRCGRPDALFLGHIVAQAFPVIENIGLVDRMATEAASQERRKIAMDLHDTAIQPYIGLRLSISALRNKASNGNPLMHDIEKLLETTTHVVSELRRYGKLVQVTSAESGSAFLASLHKQTAYIKGLYGIEIDVSSEGNININDRLAAEALQLVNEGLNNICRHTTAQHGSVMLYCADGWLRISIGNESDEQHPTVFTPKSMSARAAALGGQVRVQSNVNGYTVVEIEIPV